MQPETIQRLNDINRQFYATTATEFDQTRGTAWPGWVQLLSHIEPLVSQATMRVLDVGCGNGRFGLFLAEQVPDIELHYHGVDNNPSLLAFARHALDTTGITYQLSEHDIITQPLSDDARYDLVVLFGVIHHVPGWQNRQQFMARLAQTVAPGGLLAFTSWRFYAYDRYRQRLVAWPDDLKGQIEQHDYLLDWRRGERALRYCHYVDDDEQQALIRATGLTPIATYRADSASGDANCYSVLQRTTG